MFCLLTTIEEQGRKKKTRSRGMFSLPESNQMITVVLLMFWIFKRLPEIRLEFQQLTRRLLYFFLEETDNNLCSGNNALAISALAVSFVKTIANFQSFVGPLTFRIVENRNYLRVLHVRNSLAIMRSDFLMIVRRRSIRRPYPAWRGFGCGSPVPTLSPPLSSGSCNK